MALRVDICKKLNHFTLKTQFEASEGVTGILGASGCGKSMTLRCIAGIEKPDEGYIELNGKVFYDSKNKINLRPQERHVGLLFQNYALFPDMTVLLFFIIPIKIKWLAIIDGVFFAIEIVGAILSGNVVGAITPVLALLNFALFATPYIHYIRRRTQYRHSAGAVNFRRTVHQAQKQQQTAPYHHKCAVCGRTDTDYPDLQFRYCSKCAGYHCFCQDHIFSHVHFTEEP